MTSVQILPTILDLLRESQSTNTNSTQMINDLLPLYEGQSMIRPIIGEEAGRKNWQFTVMNTGGTWLSIRSASRPYRLVMPLVPDVEWRFSNVVEDPYETHYAIAFDLPVLYRIVESRHGSEATSWLNEAAHVAKWWVVENRLRYEYTEDEAN